jgi:hypothetical protein
MTFNIWRGGCTSLGWLFMFAVRCIVCIVVSAMKVLTFHQKKKKKNWRGVALTLPQDHLLRWKEMVAGVRMYPATHPLPLCGFGCRGLSNPCECTTICAGRVGVSRESHPWVWSWVVEIPTGYHHSITNVFLSPTTPFIFLFFNFFFLILYSCF